MLPEDKQGLSPSVPAGAARFLRLWESIWSTSSRALRLCWPTDLLRSLLQTQISNPKILKQPV